MIRAFLARRLDAFERRWGYDVGYGREILAADPAALVAFSLSGALGGYRRDVPADAWFAAKLVGTLAEDCGPCTQLVIDMAEAAGVPAATLEAVMRRDFTAMPAETALAVRFAEACLDHAPEADEMRDDIVRLWGERGLVSIAFALTAARLYPTVKYALGHGRACQRVKIGGEVQPVLRTVARAA